MSYHIRYDDPNNNDKRHQRPLFRYVAALLLILSVILTLCFPGHVREFRRHALPFFEPEVTQAFEQMLSDIHYGVTPRDAAVAFGRKLLLEESNYH